MNNNSQEEIIDNYCIVKDWESIKYSKVVDILTNCFTNYFEDFDIENDSERIYELINDHDMEFTIEDMLEPANGPNIVVVDDTIDIEYEIPVYWQMGTHVTVNAKSLKEAIEKAQDVDVPYDGEYIDDSFNVGTIEDYLQTNTVRDDEDIDE